MSYLQKHPEEKKAFEAKNPGSPATAVELIGGIVQSLSAHLAALELSPTSRVYHLYVLRTLQNYLAYGVTRLRSSDLNRGDPIFGANVDIFDHIASETAEGLHGIIEDFAIPTDGEILQRLRDTPL